MGRPVSFDFTTGGGSPEEFLMGTVHLEPTLMHTIGNTVVLPDAPYPVKLVNGKAVHPNVAVSPAGPEPEWAYKVTIENELTGKAWSEFRGVPTGTTQIAYKDLTKFVTTIPPETTAGMMQNWADTAQDGASRAEAAAAAAEAPTDLMNKNLIENPASLTAGALSAAIGGHWSAATAGQAVAKAVAAVKPTIVITSNSLGYSQDNTATGTNPGINGSSTPRSSTPIDALLADTLAYLMPASGGATVVNQSFPGDRTSEALSRWESGISGDVEIFFCLDTNDAIDAGNHGALTVAQSVANMKLLIERTNKRGAQAVVFGGFPTYVEARQRKIRAYTEAHRAVASQYAVRFVDVAELLSPMMTGTLQTPWLADGIHMNVSANRLVAAGLATMFGPHGTKPELVGPGSRFMPNNRGGVGGTPTSGRAIIAAGERIVIPVEVVAPCRALFRFYSTATEGVGVGVIPFANSALAERPDARVSITDNGGAVQLVVGHDLHVGVNLIVVSCISGSLSLQSVDYIEPIRAAEIGSVASGTVRQSILSGTTTVAPAAGFDSLYDERTPINRLNADGTFRAFTVSFIAAADLPTAGVAGVMLAAGTPGSFGPAGAPKRGVAVLRVATTKRAFVRILSSAGAVDTVIENAFSSDVGWQGEIRFTGNTSGDILIHVDGVLIRTVPNPGWDHLIPATLIQSSAPAVSVRGCIVTGG